MYVLNLLCPQDRVEIVGESLEALDALSVSVEDADAQTPAEQALFGEPGFTPERQAWQRSTISALFAEQAQAENAAKLLVVQDFFEGCQVAALQEVPDLDWVSLTQSQFAPVEITPEFWIVPSWHEVPGQARVVIELDPGMAFGTGTHPTTRMCLRWLARQAGQDSLQGRTVLDYGCGSGILAIAAAKFGAERIDAVDIDEAAIAATVANAEKNQVALRSGLPDIAAAHYDVVLANILANPLQVLAPLLCQHVAAGGHLVLAGILERQAELLQKAYAPWLQLEVTDSEDGWILMTARKPATA
ncbi:50S ribosomal protein L11 methyltransferase [Corticibacter populi]|uniref:Ribosomal protein L11 methyltransferase n=1 Tax=Corticibacter populi TaxID=1550736 RepID=A0A3M6QM46_9BURK|nr:50S ribosomal protein L11 methyltransferase [Corticibacter populi]RMX04117.1 50S ribosomal protein L11 methyltransferase [Corticibacter populi]RZS33127.1 [LSU ribosomal protein L11P]-lysine N-methyltransferase [Corticibacter populi]